MELNDLPKLEAGKTYRVKIYDEQPLPDAAPHRQIRASALGQTHEGKYMGTVIRDEGEMIEFDIGVVELKGLDDDLVKPGRKIGSFHLWLVESVELVEGS